VCCVVDVPVTAVFVVVDGVVVFSGTVVVVEASDVFITKGVVVVSTVAAVVVRSFVVVVVVKPTVVVASGTLVVVISMTAVCTDVVGCSVTYNFQSVMFASLREITNKNVFHFLLFSELSVEM